MGDDIDDELPENLSPENVVSVAQLGGEIQSLIKTHDFEHDYIIGDVTDSTVVDGTAHFDLVGDGHTIHVVDFDPQRNGGGDIGDDERVAVNGRVNYYERNGQMSIIAKQTIPVGESLYHRKIAKLREQLEEDGVFDDDLKVPLPEVPENIGIITADGSDAERDAIESIHSRYPSATITQADARVQGENAPSDIINAIAAFNSEDAIDVIVVTRGGGSEKALAPFNHQGVVRITANTPTPIVTAIGHENDTPLIDDAADDRAMTPTDVGNIVVPDVPHLQERTAAVTKREMRSYKGHVIDTLTGLQSGLKTAYTDYVTNTLRTHQNDTTAAYETHVTATLERQRSSVENAYAGHVGMRLIHLSNDEKTAYQTLRQHHQHQEDTRELRTKSKRYRYAIVLLLLFLLGMLGYIFVL